MKVRCLLWDFGDTLCNELSLWRSSPEWMDVYRSFEEEDGVGAAWSLGQLDTRQVAERLAERMSLGPEEIHAHLTRTDVFEFFPFTYDFFRSRRLPQAVVTVNPAAFRDLARAHRFDAVTEAIVISGEERTDDKGVLCQLALERMSDPYEPGEALLIDNKQHNLDAWRERGGAGYLYTGDDAFERDVGRGIEALATR